MQTARSGRETPTRSVSVNEGVWTIVILKAKMIFIAKLRGHMSKFR